MFLVKFYVNRKHRHVRWTRIVPLAHLLLTQFRLPVGQASPRYDWTASEKFSFAIGNITCVPTKNSSTLPLFSWKHTSLSIKTYILASRIFFHRCRQFREIPLFSKCHYIQAKIWVRVSMKETWTPAESLLYACVYHTSRSNVWDMTHRIPCIRGSLDSPW